MAINKLLQKKMQSFYTSFMKPFFLLFIVMISGVSAFAQTSELPEFNPLVFEDNKRGADFVLGLNQEAPRTKDKEEIIQQWFNACRSARVASANPESIEALCSCSAAKMQQQMTVQELRLLLETSEDGQKQRERLVGLIYLPCMRYPVEDIVREDCLSNHELIEGAKHPVNICGCIAHRMGDYVERDNGTVHKNTVIDYRKDARPQTIISRYFNSGAFRDTLKIQNRRCFNKHEHGW